MKKVTLKKEEIGERIFIWFNLFTIIILASLCLHFKTLTEICEYQHTIYQFNRLPHLNYNNALNHPDKAYRMFLADINKKPKIIVLQWVLLPGDEVMIPSINSYILTDTKNTQQNSGIPDFKRMHYALWSKRNEINEFHCVTKLSYESRLVGEDNYCAYFYVVDKNYTPHIPTLFEPLDLSI